MKVKDNGLVKLGVRVNIRMLRFNNLNEYKDVLEYFTKYNNIELNYNIISKNKSIIRLVNKQDNDLSVNFHDFSHINHVVNNVCELSKILEITNKEFELVKIAAFAHDIGCMYGRKNHDYNSSRIIEKQLLRMLYSHHKRVKGISYSFFVLSRVFNIYKKMNTKIRSNIEVFNDIIAVSIAIEKHRNFTSKRTKLRHLPKNYFEIVNRVSSILFIADKSDIRNSRVRLIGKHNLHKTVNYRTKEYSILANHESINLNLFVDETLVNSRIEIEQLKEDIISIYGYKLYMSKRICKNFLNKEFKISLNIGNYNKFEQVLLVL